MNDTEPRNDDPYDDVIAPDEVLFNPDAVLGAWKASNDDGVVPAVAAPIVNAFATDDDGTYFGVGYWEGVAEDRDTHFFDVEGEDGRLYHIHVEEKAVGALGRGHLKDVDDPVPGRAKKVALNHSDDEVLYVNPAQIFVRRAD